MNPVLQYEKKLYFRDFKHYLISRITHEDNYLVWKFVKYLRREEAAPNKLIAYYWRRKKNDLGSKLGFLVYAGNFGKGLHMWHHGMTFISGEAKIGENCTLHGQACLATDLSGTKAPVLGNNVDVGYGAIVIGDVYIADDVRIGAGAVVTKSCYEKGATLVGVPAKVIKTKE